MKLHTVLASVLALALAAPALAATSKFSAQLLSTGEPDPTSTATGFALITLDDTALSVGVHVTFAGLAASAVAAHIHCCTVDPGVGSAGVALGFTGFPSLQAGSFDATFVTSGAAFSSLQAGILAGKAYVNIHSGVYPGGEIRGFLAPVPEPESYALMLGGLAFIGWQTRRRLS